MRAIFNLLARQRCIIKNNGQLVLQSINVAKHELTTTSWLSSTASSSGLGGKKGSGTGSDKHRSKDNNTNGISSSNNNSNNRQIPSQSFKRMTDLVKEKTVGLKVTGSGIAGRVSSDRVKHDRSTKKFTLDLGNNRVARIDYKTIGPQSSDKIEMYHSEVPKELRGRGLGKALAKGALEQAARENIRVKLTCTYLIEFVNKPTTDPKLKKNLIS